MFNANNEVEISTSESHYRVFGDHRTSGVRGEFTTRSALTTQFVLSAKNDVLPPQVRRALLVDDLTTRRVAYYHIKVV